MLSQSQQKMTEYPRIKVIDKYEIEVFKCDECGGNFKSMTWAKQHLTKKHRASLENDQDNKGKKKASMEE